MFANHNAYADEFRPFGVKCGSYVNVVPAEGESFE